MAKISKYRIHIKEKYALVNQYYDIKKTKLTKSQSFKVTFIFIIINLVNFNFLCHKKTFYLIIFTFYINFEFVSFNLSFKNRLQLLVSKITLIILMHLIIISTFCLIVSTFYLIISTFCHNYHFLCHKLIMPKAYQRKRFTKAFFFL